MSSASLWLLNCQSESLRISTPSRSRAHYSRFRVAERLLLTGHSHQAWPDVAFEAQQHAWLDAAELVDDKWERAAQVADDVRARLAPAA